jgi:hypothetical protein
MTDLVPLERIETRIFLIRGLRVMLDADLAELYGVPTKVFNQAIKRNPDRFPADFMFQIDADELPILRSQIVTSSSSWGGRRCLPYAFTEHGAIMAASVLNSPRAIEVSVFVVRAFIKLREALLAHKEVALKLAELEPRYDAQFADVFDAIRQLMEPPPTPRKPIGFTTKAQTGIRK